ncbi:complex 1 protein-domain-containing protein [Aspergillus heterothallicus]
MRSSLKLFAAVNSTRSSKLRKPTISLDHFIQRQRVIALWREIVRALNKIPNSPTRNELRDYARQEFERHRDVTDLQHIRYLISTGKSEFDMMRRYIDEQAA